MVDIDFRYGGASFLTRPSLVHCGVPASTQIYAGPDGIAKIMDPGPPDATPYESKAEHLPATLAEVSSHLKQNQVLRDGLGSAFVDYYCKIK